MSTPRRHFEPDWILVAVVALALGIIVGAIIFSSHPALSATFHASPTGSDANPGTRAAPWRTIAKANAVMLAGDALQLAPGTYTDMPQPRAAAVGGLGFAFYGSLASPGAVVITASTFAPQSYVTVAGVRFPNGLQLTPVSARDSIRSCIVDGYCGQAFSRYVVFDRCTFTTDQKVWLGAGSADSTDERTVGLQFHHCAWPSAGFGYAGTDGEQKDWCVGWGTDSMLFQFNRVRLRLPDVPDAPSRYFHMTRSLFRGNHYDVTSLIVRRGLEGFFMLRDSSSGNRFVSDTIMVTGSADLAISAAGRKPNNTLNNAWDSCFVQLPDGTVWAQDGLNGTSITYCTFISGTSPAISVLAAVGVRKGPGTTGVSSIRHCTLAGHGHGAALDLHDAGVWDPGTRLVLESNLFYDLDAPVTHDNLSQSWWLERAPVSLGKIAAWQGKLESDRNLFAYYGWNTTPGDRCIFWDSGGYHSSRPGAGGEFATLCGQDGSSVYGSPQFGMGGADSTFSNQAGARALDPRLGFASAARRAGSSGTDAGALSPADTARPSRLTLTVR